jgi:hypothetical protein
MDISCSGKYNFRGEISRILLGDRERYRRVELRWVLGEIGSKVRWWYNCRMDFRI